MQTYKLKTPDNLGVTAEELARRYKEHNPDIRLGYTRDGAAIGYFAEGRWWVYASGTIIGDWVAVNGQMPLINGKKPYPDEDFIEIN